MVTHVIITLAVTSDNDLGLWCPEHAFSLKCQTSTCTASYAHKIWNSLTGIGRQWVRNKFSKELKIYKEWLLLTKITLHHLFFLPVCDSSVMVFDLGIFLLVILSLRKMPRSKIVTSDFPQWPQERWFSAIIVQTILNALVTMVSFTIDHNLMKFEIEVKIKEKKRAFINWESGNQMCVLLYLSHFRLWQVLEVN